MTVNKNIVLCLDGTGNRIKENLSNVLKTYRIARKDEKQIVYYDQGVGTIEHTFSWSEIKQKFDRLLGLGFGYGLDRNVLQAYEFLVNHYQEYESENKIYRDKIFIFGFSRGAHTARVLAGLLYEIGLLKPEEIHLAKAALKAYKQSGRKRAIKKPNETTTQPTESSGASFRRIIQPKTMSIEFLGVFDTVSSVFTPNPNGIFPPIVSEKLPHTQENPGVRCFRQAISIDERRRMFRIDRWKKDQWFKPNPYSKETPPKQDSKEVWFRGFHSDIGGGLNRKNNGLAQIPFIWLMEQAEAQGLNIYHRMFKYVSGQQPYSKTTEFLYPSPNFKANSHNPMNFAWKLLEVFPKKSRSMEFKEKRQFFGWYLPLEEPRSLNSDDIIHQSVHDRMTTEPPYRPINLSHLEENQIQSD